MNYFGKKNQDVAVSGSLLLAGDMGKTQQFTQANFFSYIFKYFKQSILATGGKKKYPKGTL